MYMLAYWKGLGVLLLAALTAEVGSKAKTLVAFFTGNLDFLVLLYTRGPQNDPMLTFESVKLPKLHLHNLLSQ